MSGDVIDIFSGLVVENAAGDRPLLPNKPRRPYKPYETANDIQLNLRIYAPYGSASATLVSYTHQTQALLLPDNQRLDLFYQNLDTVYMIWGRNLEALLEPVQDRKLRAVYCFTEEEYLKPDESQPVITQVKAPTIKFYRNWMAKQKQQRQESN